MLFKSIIALPALALLAAAAPNWKPTTTTDTWGPTTTTPTSTWGTTKTSPTSTWGTTKTTPTSTWGTTPTTTTATAPSPTSTNNGQQFLNYCENLGISILDCSDLLNIAALNGNSVGVGSSGLGGSGSGSVNNGQQFLNECKNVGISVADCAELLNIALLNGNTIDIDLPDLTSLISALGLSPTLISGLLPLSGLVAIPTGLL